jgi:hypothetical protein
MRRWGSACAGCGTGTVTSWPSGEAHAGLMQVLCRVYVVAASPSPPCLSIAAVYACVLALPLRPALSTLRSSRTELLAGTGRSILKRTLTALCGAAAGWQTGASASTDAAAVLPAWLQAAGRPSGPVLPVIRGG